MNTVSPIEPEVKVLVTYPLFNDHVFVYGTDTDDITRIRTMVRIAGLNIPTGSGLYILENPTDNPFLGVTAGYFYSFDLDDNIATFALVKHPGSEDKKVIEDIMSNPNDYELFAKLSVKATIGNSHVKSNKSGDSFFFLRNKKYIISKEISTTDSHHKAFIKWTKR